MGMTPEIYLEAFVEANANDCSDSPGDVRRAFNAAVAASHFADHFYAYAKRHNHGVVSQFVTMSSFLEHLSRATAGAFQDIRSIANAYKHLYTDVGAGSTYCTVSSAGSIDSVEIADDEHIESITEAFLDNSAVNGQRYTVLFKRKDGTSGEFLPTLEKVIDHFWSMLN